MEVGVIRSEVGGDRRSVRHIGRRVIRSEPGDVELDGVEIQSTWSAALSAGMRSDYWRPGRNRSPARCDSLLVPTAMLSFGCVA